MSEETLKLKAQLARYKEAVELARYVVGQYGPEGRTPLTFEAWETLGKVLNDPNLKKKGAA